MRPPKMPSALAGPLARSAVSASGLMLTGSAASWMLPNCNAHIGSSILSPYYSSIQGHGGTRPPSKGKGSSAAL